MKSGGPWNLRGLRPETREAARDAARRAGVSVGEWLNDVIQESDEEYSEPVLSPRHDDERDDGWRDYMRRRPRRESRQEPHQQFRPEPRQELSRDPYREAHLEPSLEPVRHRDHYDRDFRDDRGYEDRDPPRPRREREPEAAIPRKEFGEVHARLDRLTQQLDRLARTNARQLTGAPVSQYGDPPAQSRKATPPRPRNGSQGLSNGAGISVDEAVAEIAARQRALDEQSLPVAPAVSLAPAAPAPDLAAPSPRPAPAAEHAVDISNLEEQLRYITTRLESLRPSSELEKIIQSFRQDLGEIRQQLTEALPRRAMESLEIEVQALAQRLDHSRATGVDTGVLANLERGLGEVRDALHGLMPAENLIGFDEAVRTLSQKVDLIIGKEDPAALEQLETAIGALRGIVSHVASNDTLTKVAEDVRALAGKVDVVANSAPSGPAFSALESRIDSLASALNASTEVGHAVPRELEKLLSGLIEKLEWVQLTHADHAALGSLEDRITQFMRRLDASDAKLGNLEAVERGLAELLVHIDQFRAGAAVSTADAPQKPAVMDVIERDIAEMKSAERRNQDSLEAVQAAVEHVVDRLAMIESGKHAGAAQPQSFAAPRAAAEPAPETVSMASVAIPTATSSDQAARHGSTPRAPIDPNLPPDHPLEPGSAAGSRTAPSAAERIASSEAVAGLARPPVIADPGEKPNFIAAARRAAQAAAAAPPERQPRVATATPQSEQPSRLRKLLVAGGAVLIAVLCVHVALRMYQDHAARGVPMVVPQGPTPQATPPKLAPQSDSSKTTPPQPGPLILPVPSAPAGDGSNAAPNAAPDKPASSAPAPSPGVKTVVPPPAMPQQQSWLQNSMDITGALPALAAPPKAQPPAATATIQAPPAPAAAPGKTAEALPTAIGGPKLRAAALAGDAAAEFEIGTRFAEGHGVPTNNAEAAHWLDLAVKQGLAPAQFRLGGFYEKGLAVKKDLAIARDLYTAAAAKGNGKAMHNLAVLYAEGIDGPPDYRTAAQWFRRAAEHGIADSQYNLAVLYARGIGVEQDYAESYKWFALAANRGDSDAGKKRDEVGAHLDAQALAAVKLAVQKWSAEPQPAEALGVKPPPGGWDAPAHEAKPKSQPTAGKPIELGAQIN